MAAPAGVKDVTAMLESVVDGSRIITDPEYLTRFARDTSCTMQRMPDVAVQALSTDEVQAVVRCANEHRIPIVPKSSGIGFYGAAVPEQGGIMLDMSGMNRVRRIDSRNKWVMFEAGATHADLQHALAPEGMRPIVPLMPHPQKSALTSLLEREPRLTPKHHLDETILTMEMVLPTGELFHTGSMAISPSAPEKIPDEVPSDLCNFMGPGIDWFRLIPGALGSFGIVTVMNMKAGFVPSRQKPCFFGFERLEDCTGFWYHVLRSLIGDECLLLSSRLLAALLCESPEDIPGTAACLPPYVLVVNMTAGEWYPDEKMAYQEEALHDAARLFLCKPLEELPHVGDAGPRLSRCLYNQGGSDGFWKFRAKGASRDIFFLTQLQRAPEFLQVVRETATALDFPAEDIGLYLQPKQNGRAFHMEACIPFNPEDPADRQRSAAVFSAVSRALVDRGAFFYRIYGEWAGLVYPRTASLHRTLKRIKRLLDPNDIMNPGKLGF